MKNRIITTVFALGLLASSCKKDDLVNATMDDQIMGNKLEMSSLNSIDFDNNYGGSQHDYGTSIATSKDGSYVLAGRTQSQDGDITGFHGYVDGLLIKIDKHGNKLWQKTYGGSGIDGISCISATRDGGYIFAGGSESGDGDLSGEIPPQPVLWVVKVDSHGTIEWSKKIQNNSLTDWIRRPTSIIETRSGDYILAGLIFSTGIQDFNVNGWFCKIGNSGTVIWEKIRGDVDQDEFQQVVEDKNGYLWLVGTWGRPGDHRPLRGDVWLVKADSDGNISWQKKYGGSRLDEGNSLAIDHNKGILLAGRTYSRDGDVAGFHGGEYDAWVIKVDMNGKKIWQKSAGGRRADLFSRVIVMKNGGYLLAGQTNSQDGDVKNGTSSQSSDGWVVKLSDSGVIQSEKTYGDGFLDIFNFITEGNGNNYAVGGTKGVSGVDYNLWLIGITKP